MDQVTDEERRGPGQANVWRTAGRREPGWPGRLEGGGIERLGGETFCRRPDAWYDEGKREGRRRDQFHAPLLRAAPQRALKGIRPDILARKRETETAGGDLGLGARATACYGNDTIRLEGRSVLLCAYNMQRIHLLVIATRQHSLRSLTGHRVIEGPFNRPLTSVSQVQAQVGAASPPRTPAPPRVLDTSPTRIL